MRDLLLYVVGFFLFAGVRPFADEVGIPVKAAYVLDADKWLFAGTFPTDWLQRRLHASGPVGAFDFACVAVYSSYFVVPHIVALVLWWRNPARFRRYAGALVLTLYVGLAVSFVVPTAPPWLADRFTNAPHILHVIPYALGVDPKRASDSNLAEGNLYAATPSIHFALTVLVALALWRRPVMRWVGLAYTASMGFTLVYTGEHYVTDELMGTAVALLAWAAVGLVQSRRSAAVVERESAFAPSGIRTRATALKGP